MKENRQRLPFLGIILGVLLLCGTVMAQVVSGAALGRASAPGATTASVAAAATPQEDADVFAALAPMQRSLETQTAGFLPVRQYHSLNSQLQRGTC